MQYTMYCWIKSQKNNANTSFVLTIKLSIVMFKVSNLNVMEIT